MAFPNGVTDLNMVHEYDADMAEFFDFDYASNMIPMEISNDGGAASASSAIISPTASSLLPECAVIEENFGIGPDECQSIALDFSNFAKWIPRYSKPDHSCDYCKSRHLECWFTFENQTGCSACCALFRPCSFTMENTAPTDLMDTLHVVQEDQVQISGGLTGLKALRSWDRTALDNPDFDDDERSMRRSSSRFSKEAIVILRKWMDAHKDRPYPTDEEKELLQSRTGLTNTQISNWLANTRRRNKSKKIRGVSPSMRSPAHSIIPGSRPIPMPLNSVHNGKVWEIMNPMERWKASPPENEPALVTDIANALATSKLRNPESSSYRGPSRTAVDSSDSGSIFSGLLPPSVTSLETAISESQQSQQSSGSFSTHSIGSSRSLGSRNSLHSSGSGPRKDKRRRRKVVTRLNMLKSNDLRPFQCTFCTDTFRTKYDWVRHEKSLHLTLEKWICGPLGAVISSPGGMLCVFCGEMNPDEAHIEKHNHQACHDKGIEGRTFYRKDHLRQHLRLVHGCKMIDTMDSWKSETLHIQSRCGFCREEFDNWNDRCEHLAHHFKNGAKMVDWKGCRGLSMDVAKHVTHAMPPFLIGKEAVSPNPFSASSRASKHSSPLNEVVNYTEESSAVDQLALWNGSTDCPASMVPLPAGVSQCEVNNWSLQHMEAFNPTRASPRISTCWEVLTVRLGLYVRDLQRSNVSITDDMLQSQARIILYGDDDSWNQTSADDDQWLQLFKKAHGLPSTQMNVSTVDPMEDLGMGVADMSFDNMFQDPSWDAVDVTQGLESGFLTVPEQYHHVLGM